MDFDTSIFLTRRHRHLFSAFHLIVSLSLRFTCFVQEFLVCLGFLSSFAVASYERWCQWNLFILWLLSIPCPSLMSPLVPDLKHFFFMVLLRFQICRCCDACELSCLLRRWPFSLSIFLVSFDDDHSPSGKIDYVWFLCEYGSCTSLFGHGLSDLCASEGLNTTTELFQRWTSLLMIHWPISVHREHHTYLHIPPTTTTNG